MIRYRSTITSVLCRQIDIYCRYFSNVRDPVELVTSTIWGGCSLNGTCQFAKTLTPLKQQLYVHIIHAENKHAPLGLHFTSAPMKYMGD